MFKIFNTMNQKKNKRELTCNLAENFDVSMLKLYGMSLRSYQAMELR